MTVRKIERTPSAYDYPLLIKNLLRPPMRYFPHREIVYKDRVRYTYQDLDRRIAQLAHALNRIGVRKGETVSVMEWDSHRYLECFFAIPMMGCVLHPINIRRPPESLVHTLNHAESRVILANADFFPALESIKDRLDGPKTIILITDDGIFPETALTVIGEYESMLTQHDDVFSFPDFDENAMASIFYSTGATGSPKGVCFSHRQLVLHTYGVMAGLCAYGFHPSVNADDVYMPLTPMFHVNAWSLFYLFTLLGAKQVYPGKYDPKAILDLIVREGVTFSHSDTPMIHTLVNCPDIRGFGLTGWKVIVGGAPLSKSVCRAALSLGIDICSVYGMAETGPLLAASLLKPEMRSWDPERQVDVRCRTGIPSPMVDIEVTDIKGTPLPHDGKSIGEVVLRAPWLTQGYAKDPEKSEKLWSDGWLHTGDIGFIDADGYLQITDRTRDAIKAGGEWIDTMALEDLICEHEGISEAAVVAVPDEKYGERPMAFVVLKEGYRDRMTEEDLREFLSARVKAAGLPGRGIPDKIAFVETIPTTSVGKISRKQLLEKQSPVPFDLKNGP
ncbi:MULTISPECIES: fatty acid--CoA ligase [Desulfococcus]|jgi:fatty-acyl-CoA synthase|uniref:AMP-dependent synthetase and ligase n=1 Tax=Desulfococcus multivorans DSM 2059 TaxID=1121405 RepID=S7TH07_DESML|nr:fatty acid--CoA ligase [Desulfococcus multivorans]AOY59887.1 AMP-dependent synthetase and ligase [Desulfococcus multivorans]AQV03081.1 long-chain fatty acid--CoA ligase [Desulfococcus multivorans]EPR35885.1 AMP-dependent synthetase and ligase [Desulfococcus multivorans DSM 2059]MDX9819663.1 fatty acid--CoA ligase [Desulfococcus multivorans]SJZ34600.1 fatty-acyl-CoA synthase [Desulfococcus multivorans DSM 2059]